MGPNDLARQLDAFRDEVPTHLRFGVGTMREAASVCAPIGSRILVVTGRQAMQRCGVVQQLCTDLDAAGIAWARWAGLHAGPTTDDIDCGAAACREFGADMILALGGGNVIDGAKAIAAVAPSCRIARLIFSVAKRCQVWARCRSSRFRLRREPAANSTAVAIMTDPQRQLRDGIRSDWLFPRVAIVDAALMCSLDRLQTAITGFDCLSHAVESYVSPKARPDTDRLARQAMRLVCRYLPDALADPADIEAREQLARASTTMGVNLSCVGTCYPHRVDKAVCALYPHIPHGQSVALFYPHWIAFSQVGNPAKFADVAEILDPRTATLSVEDRAANLPAIMRGFLERLGLRGTPADFGMTPERIPDIAARVRGDLAVNPVPIERRALPDLLGQVFQQQQQQRNDSSKRTRCAMNEHFRDRADDLKRRLYSPHSLLRVVGAHNALGAQLIEQAGFDGLWAGSLEITTTCGRVDDDSSILTDILPIARLLASRSRLPVIADGGTGADTPAGDCHARSSLGACGRRCREPGRRLPPEKQQPAAGGTSLGLRGRIRRENQRSARSL